MKKRTKILLSVLACASLFLGGTLFQAYRNAKLVAYVINEANTQIYLANNEKLRYQIQLCIVSANASVFKYLRTNEERDVVIVPILLDHCDEWLDRLGKNSPDEKTSAMLGQARLFFDGFRESAMSILDRQRQLEELYAGGLTLLAEADKLRKIKKLEEEQSKAVLEFTKFTSTIYLSLIQAAPSSGEMRDQ